MSERGATNNAYMNIVMVTSSIWVKELECSEQIFVEVVRLNFGEREAMIIDEQDYGQEILGRNTQREWTTL